MQRTPLRGAADANVSENGFNMIKQVMVAIVLMLIVGCGSSPDEEKLVVWDETLWVAKREGLNYIEHYKKALEGSESDIKKLMEFSEEVDAASALGHGVVLYKIKNNDQELFESVHSKYVEEVWAEYIPRLLEAGEAYSQ